MNPSPFIRALSTVALPPWHGVLRVRNHLYDRRILSAHSLGRWTISVGNITFGGTGKTPMVVWLATELKKLGHHPAVLLRGYKSRNGQSDEAVLLTDKLPGTPVIPNPDRIAGAATALTQAPETDLFILDDGMQHRRARRDADIVLINAAQPRGSLLREPLSGLRRAAALVLTHSNENPNLSEIESTLRSHNSTAPILHCDHVHLGLLDAAHRHFPMGTLAVTRFVTACGIGNPQSFLDAIVRLGGKSAGSRVYSDHHRFTAAAVDDLQKWAKSVGATSIVVTEKDWVKLAGFPAEIPFLRVRLGIRFHPGEDQTLLEIVRPKA